MLTDVTNPSDFMTTAQVAEVLRCSTRTVTRLAVSGELEEFQKLPGLRGPRVFHRNEVARLAAERNLS